MVRLAPFLCGIALAALAGCAQAPGQGGQTTITATDSCVLIIFGGGNTGGTATASPPITTTITPGMGLGLLGEALAAAAPEKGSSQICTVSPAHVVSPNGAVDMSPAPAPEKGKK